MAATITELVPLPAPAAIAILVVGTSTLVTGSEVDLVRRIGSVGHRAPLLVHLQGVLINMLINTPPGLGG